MKKTKSPHYDPVDSIGITEPGRWWQMISRFQGSDLNVIGIIVISLFGSSFAIVLVGDISLVLVASWRIYQETRDGPALKQESENTIESGTDETD